MSNHPTQWTTQVTIPTIQKDTHLPEAEIEDLFSSISCPNGSKDQPGLKM